MQMKKKIILLFFHHPSKWKIHNFENKTVINLLLKRLFTPNKTKTKLFYVLKKTNRIESETQTKHEWNTNALFVFCVYILNPRWKDCFRNLSLIVFVVLFSPLAKFELFGALLVFYCKLKLKNKKRKEICEKRWRHGTNGGRYRYICLRLNNKRKETNNVFG